MPRPKHDRESAIDLATDHILAHIPQALAAPGGPAPQAMDRDRARQLVAGFADGSGAPKGAQAALGGKFNFAKFKENFNKALPVINLVLGLLGVPVTIPPLADQDA